MFSKLSIIFLYLPAATIGAILFTTHALLVSSTTHSIEQAQQVLNESTLSIREALEKQGIVSLRSIAESAVRRIDIYLEKYPELTTNDLYGDPFIVALGKEKHEGLGYLVLQVAENSTFITHPNPAYVGKSTPEIFDLREAKYAEIKSFTERRNNLEYTEGYYNFPLPSGELIRKYQTAPITKSATADGKHIAVVATITPDEYAPELREMKSQLASDDEKLQMSTQADSTLKMTFIAAFFISLTLLVVFTYSIQKHFDTHKDEKNRRRFIILGMQVMLLLVLSTNAYTAYLFYTEQHNLNQTITETLTRTSVHIHTILNAQILKYIEDTALRGAEETDVYLSLYPELTLQDMFTSNTLKTISSPLVGATGYISIVTTENITYVTHPNDTIIGASFLESERFNRPFLNDLKVLMTQATTGIPVKGAYEWLEKDGRITEKYLAAVPTQRATADGHRLLIAATTYPEEGNFSENVVQATVADGLAELESSSTNYLKQVLIITVSIYLFMLTLTYASLRLLQWKLS